MEIHKDFTRNVYCLLGLPFDAVNTHQAVQEIVTAVETKNPLYLATPNLNFICAATIDAEFKKSIINSDLSIVDGFPIVVVAKLLQIPIPERIGGSNLIEHLYQCQTDKPIKACFFGGEDSTAELACEKINRHPAGLKAVGCYAPGFGSVEDMSTAEILQTINRHDIDFLMISLGAKKGQAWIERNRPQLKATVIGYLGAVINFFAGTVKRAPLFFQKSGLEWLWRIYQEPLLWRRYFDDGLCFLKLLGGNVLPYWFWLKFCRPKKTQELTVNIITAPNNSTLIELTGDITSQNCAPLRTIFSQSINEKNNIIIDLQNVRLIDSAFIGLCLILYKHLFAADLECKLINADKTVNRILKWHKVNDLFC